MSIKLIKVASVWIDEADKEIVSKKEKTLGKKYNVCKASIKVADDCKFYAGKNIQMGFFADVEHKRTGKSQAEYFKSQNEGKELLLDVIEQEYTDKEGNPAISLKGSKLSKAKKEAYEQILAEMKNNEF